MEAQGNRVDRFDVLVMRPVFCARQGVWEL